MRGEITFHKTNNNTEDTLLGVGIDENLQDSGVGRRLRQKTNITNYLRRNVGGEYHQ